MSGNDGTAQALVNAGTVTGGTGAKMQYAIGTSSAPTGSYGDAIPEKTDAGTYYVWYKVIGGSGYSDQTDLGPIAVTIQKKDPELKLQDYDMTGLTSDTYAGTKPTVYNDLTNKSGTIGSGMFTLFHVCHMSDATPTLSGSGGTLVDTGSSKDHTNDKDVLVNGAGTITVQLSATTNYKAASATFTATVADYVDLGLSKKWASKNLGASSPTDYGDYYAWAD